eukprot:4319431-Amphidinium_carterae.1
MIHQRLQVLDPHLAPYQFGYRRGKSTSNAVFVVRRLQELAEREGQSLFMLALDFSKAFDSISHQKLLSTLKRYHIPPAILNVISAIYTGSRFRATLTQGISETEKQGIGIRQGCPLSPYRWPVP